MARFKVLIFAFIYHAAFVYGSQKNVECGGVLTDIMGSINYKSADYLTEDEVCFWLINAGNKSSISIQLVVDGLQQFKGDYLYVYSTADYGAFWNELDMTPTLRLLPGNRTVFTVEGPIIISLTVGFTSTSRGFIISYSGVDEDLGGTVDFQRFVLDGSSGSGQYRGKEFDFEDPDLICYESVSLVLIPPPKFRLFLTLSNFVNGHDQNEDYRVSGLSLNVREIGRGFHVILSLPRTQKENVTVIATHAVVLSKRYHCDGEPFEVDYSWTLEPFGQSKDSTAKIRRDPIEINQHT